VSRTRDQDACPGALQVHQAADGALARVRLPGGVINAAQLQALAEVAEQFGAGTLELTGRGNLQVRGIGDPAAVAAAVAAAGLLPSPTHERVRNIVASPLSGRVGGRADVGPWVRELDEAIQADPALADLPGRFWFSLDDGSADVSGLAADVGVHVLPDGVALLLAGHDTGVRLDRDESVPVLISVARRFLRVRGNAWRVDELADPDVLLGDLARITPAGGRFEPGRPPIGWIPQDPGRSGPGSVALGAAVPLGVLTARQARFVAAIDAPIVVTPWRSLVIADLDESVADTSLRVLAPLGLVFDANSRWLDVSACVGSPGCAQSRADVRAEAARAAESGPVAGAVHYVGCERACGRPSHATVLLAGDTGYSPLPNPRSGNPRSGNPRPGNVG
jgi:precorrin-3B synthase